MFNVAGFFLRRNQLTSLCYSLAFNFHKVQARPLDYSVSGRLHVTNVWLLWLQSVWRRQWLWKGRDSVRFVNEYEKNTETRVNQVPWGMPSVRVIQSEWTFFRVLDDVQKSIPTKWLMTPILVNIRRHLATENALQSFWTDWKVLSTRHPLM